MRLYYVNMKDGDLPCNFTKIQNTAKKLPHPYFHQIFYLWVKSKKLTTEPRLIRECLGPGHFYEISNGTTFPFTRPQSKADFQ